MFDGVTAGPGEAEKEILVKKLIVVLVIAGVVAVFLYLRGGEEGAPEAAPETTTVKVERGSIVMKVSTTGRAVANLDVDIKCKASGEVMKLAFDVSDSVKKGDLLVELDPVDEERIVKQTQISLSASEARLSKARQNLKIARNDREAEKKRADAALKSAMARAQDAQAKFERVRQLLEKKLASQEECDTARAASLQAVAELVSAQVRVEEVKTQELALELKRQDVTLAAAQVESDKISLSISQQRLKDTKVYAPIDGIVSARNVQIGQIISSGISNVGGGTTVLTLSDLSRLFVFASVDESDIGKVKVNQPATITADAYPGESFAGRIVRIATRGVATSNVVTFEVRIEVLGEKKQLLKPEMTANIEIIADREEDALLVPVEAVFRMRGKRFATVQKADGATEEREVQVGITDGVNMAIASGLTEGEAVVVYKGEAESRWRSMSGTRRMMFMGRAGRKKK